MDLTLLDEVKTQYPISLIEHASSSYAPRTYENAHKSDLTIAFAFDFQTAGERCTLKAAGNKYVAVPLTWGVERAAQYIGKHIFESGARRLNIAGNGIYTLSRSYGYTQHIVNQKVYDVLKRVVQKYDISEIRSGGQTGVDVAGLVAGMKLNIQTVGLFPKGWRQRFDDGVDQIREREMILTELMHYVEDLSEEERTTQC